MPNQPDQHIQNTHDLPVCKICELPLLASPPDEIPGLEYFGHRMLKCDNCGNTVVITATDGE
jgi:hypothetical protein